MPVKNAESYLKETLLSIINQTHKKWELIVVDDHSDDSSLQILNSFAQLDNRIIPLKNKGEGIIDALILAIGKARGEYVIDDVEWRIEDGRGLRVIIQPVEK